jgi:hypothetical protein
LISSPFQGKINYWYGKNQLKNTQKSGSKGDRKSQRFKRAK